MTQVDIEYYTLRERQEREHARRADDPSARFVHLDLAHRYWKLARDSSATVLLIPSVRR